MDSYKLNLTEMSESNKHTDLEKPQYNSTLKYLKKLDEINNVNGVNKQASLADEDMEKINEKVPLFSHFS